jgi:acyl transferase domain-containing protein/acyl-CoA synthetase (AMP-forming)/AMP-acid ligase II/NADPH:quinone reductase-like Zn-dependent oxidoreductase/NADP-dependent 3-hydroxy acid dehydrogenase YdfG/acyl carrier protein
LIELLRQRAEAEPDGRLFTFLRDGEQDEEHITYGELDAAARTLAVELAERTQPGDRALLVYAPGLDYIRAFFGCLYAGVVAVPLYPPGLNRLAPPLARFADDCDAALILTVGDFEEAVRSQPGIEKRPTFVTDDLSPDAADSWKRPDVDDSALAFLQYTSGSTSFPKGVMLSHRNLVKNIWIIRDGTFQSEVERSQGVSWLPPYHDMGLIGGVLWPIGVGFPAVHLSPLHFLERPMRWLEALSRYRATVTGAPNFAYELATRRATDEDVASLDLSTLHIFMNAAEAVRPETIDAFCERFGPCGARREQFLPAYGLAEATLMVSAGRTRPIHADSSALERGEVALRTGPGRGVRSIEALGPPRLETRLAIVDPETCKRVPEGRVGEAWVSGPSVARGYWGKPEETERTFAARIAGEDGDETWLRTGDRGFIDGGEFVWTGRLKDLMVVRGRNVHPEDVELTVESSHSALRPGCGVAFAHDGDDEQALTIVQELRRDADSQATEAAEAIRRAVSREHQVPVERVVLIEAGGAPKTSSGKKQRRATRELLEAGELPVIHDATAKLAAAANVEVGDRGADAAPAAAEQPASRSSAEVSRWLTDHLAGALGVAATDVDPRTPLIDVGLSSVQAAELAEELGRWLGRDLSMTLTFDHPTIERLAAHLGDDSVPARPPTVGRSPSGRSRPNGDDGTQEPVAILGMGCRFPGAPDPDALLEMLRTGGDGITEVPLDRWDADALFDPELKSPGKVRTRWGGFLDGIDQFDPQFFGITPREARSIDPHQRLLLEVAWEALEDGALDPHRMRGKDAGVFVGIGGIDYQARLARRLRMIDPHSGVGNSHSIAANRLSFLLDFHGPSVAVDTACSSASVAIHLACQSLESGECDMALAAGANVILTPETTIAFSAARMLSPDGRCRTFDEAANGYVRSEGCGVIVLKRLSDAIRDGDRIRGVIRGTAVNQDGQTNGLTAPSAKAQQAVIRTALARAGIEAHELGYVEAHGTGTPLGDPIEVEGIAGAIGPRRDESHRLPMGSVKGNIGHTETVAGVAGVIKTVLALENREIYPQPHFEELNKRIKLDDTPLEVARELQEWEANGGPRFAGVNSFGFGGTNAHVVVEEAPAPVATRNRQERPRHVLTLSARSSDALAELAGRYSRACSEMPEEAFLDACYTAQLGRAHFEHRAAIVAADGAEACKRLDALASGEAGATAAGHVHNGVRPMVGFLFTGQGAQYLEMGRALRKCEPTFRRALTDCAEMMDAYLDHDVLDVIDGKGPEGLLDDTRYTQPALFVVEWALAELWRSWGIQPDAVLGHSVGEYVAACVSGAMELEDGVMLIAERARLMSDLPAGGGMASVLASEEQVEKMIEDTGARVALAAINGPTSVTIAGEVAELDRISERFEQEGMSTRRLKVSHAFHSELMEPMVDELERIAARFDYREPRIPLIVNTTGRPLEPGQAPDARHWRDHTRSPVRFDDGLRAMVGLGAEVFVEVGPHPALISLGKHCVGGAGRAWVPSLRRGQDDLSTALGSLATLYVNGVEPDWRAFHRRWHRRPVQLPTYAFQRSRYWIDIDPDGEGAEDAGGVAGASTADHPLLGRRLATGNVVLEGRIGPERHPYLEDHRVQGRAMLPATAYLEMALAAAGHGSGDAPKVLRDVVLRQPLVFGQDAARVQVSVVPLEGGESEVTVQSARGDGSSNGSASWTLHARATAGGAGAEPEGADLDELRGRCGEEISIERVYAGLERRGLQYGPAFRGLRRAWRGERDVIGEAELPEEATGDGYRAHPALLDACLHAIAAAQPEPQAGEGPMIPIAIDSVTIHAPLPRSVVVHAEMAGEPDPGEVIADVSVLDPGGATLAELRGLHLLAIDDRGSAGGSDDPARWFHELAFEPQEGFSDRAVPADGGWLVLADRTGVGEALAERIRPSGGRCVLAFRGDELERLDEDGFVVAPDGVGALIDEAFGKDESPNGVVHLWGLDAPEAGEDGWLDASLAAGCDSLMNVVQALVAAKRRTRLEVVTRGAHRVGEDDAPSPAQATLFGFTRSLSLEHPELSVAAVDIDPAADPKAAARSLAAELAAEAEPVVALRPGTRHVGRLVRPGSASSADAAASNGSGPAPLAAPRGAFRLRTRTAGVLDALELAPAERHPPGPGQVELEVRAAGLNFRDVMKVMGVYPGSAADRRSLGDECSGVVVAVGDCVEGVAVGDDVVAVAPTAFASHVTTLASLVVPKPEQLSYAQAAALPIAFMTAVHSLRHVARLREGERCLIHAAAGGVGMAAIQVAQAAGAEVFATAGSDEKRDLLRSLGVEHVMDSRSLSFADRVRELTNGEGVDVVLNSLGGEAIPRSLALLRPFGHFVEIGKRDIFQNSRVGLRPFSKAISFHAVDLDRLMRERIAYGGELLHEVMDGFADGTFQPPPVHVERVDQVGRAFRTMAQARHVGKLSISFEGVASDGEDAQPKVRSDGTYVVTGGFGALGLAVARRLAERGAGAIALVGRREAPKEVEEAATEIEAGGTRVLLEVADATSEDDLARVFSRLSAEAPEVRGVVHAAGSLDDAFVVNLTSEQTRQVVAPKALGAWALHRLTEDLPLDFFVLFSSATAVLGSPGQAHYAAGNAFMNALAEQRRHASQTSLSIGWGPWAEIGMAARKGDESRSVVDQAGSIPPEVGLDLLEQLIGEDACRSEVLPFDWEEFGALFPALGRSPLISDLVGSKADGREVDPAVAEILAAASEDLDDALERFVRTELGRVVEIDPDELDPAIRVNDIGLDSMMALELKNRVEGALEIELPIVELIEGPSISELAVRLAELMREERGESGENGKPVPEADPAAAAVVGS